jgi:hypothetical protein
LKNKIDAGLIGSPASAFWYQMTRIPGALGGRVGSEVTEMSDAWLSTGRRRVPWQPPESIPDGKAERVAETKERDMRNMDAMPMRHSPPL